jgi:hypothetical protein
VWPAFRKARDGMADVTLYSMIGVVAGEGPHPGGQPSGRQTSLPAGRDAVRRAPGQKVTQAQQ